MHVSVLSCEQIFTTTQHYDAFQCCIVTAVKTHCNKADLILYFNIIVIEVGACIFIKCFFLPLPVLCSLYVTLIKPARSLFYARFVSCECDAHNQWLVLPITPTHAHSVTIEIKSMGTRVRREGLVVKISFLD